MQPSLLTPPNIIIAMPKTIDRKMKPWELFVLDRFGLKYEAGNHDLTLPDETVKEIIYQLEVPFRAYESVIRTNVCLTNENTIAEIWNAWHNDVLLSLMNNNNLAASDAEWVQNEMRNVLVDNFFSNFDDDNKKTDGCPISIGYHDNIRPCDHKDLQTVLFLGAYALGKLADVPVSSRDYRQELKDVFSEKIVIPYGEILDISELRDESRETTLDEDELNDRLFDILNFIFSPIKVLNWDDKSLKFETCTSKKGQVYVKNVSIDDVEWQFDEDESFEMVTALTMYATRKLFEELVG